MLLMGCCCSILRHVGKLRSRSLTAAACIGRCVAWATAMGSAGLRSTSNERGEISALLGVHGVQYLNGRVSVDMGTHRAPIESVCLDANHDALTGSWTPLVKQVVIQ